MTFKQIFSWGHCSLSIFPYMIEGCQQGRPDEKTMKAGFLYVWTPLPPSFVWGTFHNANPQSQFEDAV